MPPPFTMIAAFIIVAWLAALLGGWATLAYIGRGFTRRRK